MGREERRSCPLCDNPEVGITRHPTRDAFDISCRRCGHFTVSGTLYAIKGISAHLRPALAAYTRDRTESEAIPEMLSTGNIETLAQPYFKVKPLEKLERLLRVLIRRGGHLGAHVSFDPEWDYPLAYAKNGAEAAYHRTELVRRGGSRRQRTELSWSLTRGGSTQRMPRSNARTPTGHRSNDTRSRQPRRRS